MERRVAEQITPGKLGGLKGVPGNPHHVDVAREELPRRLIGADGERAVVGDEVTRRRGGAAGDLDAVDVEPEVGAVVRAGDVDPHIVRYQ